MTTSMGVVYGKWLHESVQGCTRGIPTQLPTPSGGTVFSPTLLYYKRDSCVKL